MPSPALNAFTSKKKKTKKRPKILTRERDTERKNGRTGEKEREERRGVKKIIIILKVQRKTQRETKPLWAEGNTPVTIQQMPGVISIH